MERDHGRIVSVSTRTLGSVLDGDHAAGATSLVLFDAGDFDETGGTLSVNGATLAYASVDDDADIITLSDPLPAAALDGDFVACWDTLYDTASTVKTAMVQLDGDDDNPDPIEATVPDDKADKIADGDRGGPGESVTVEYDEEEDEWIVLRVHGLAGASGAGEKHCNTDTFTVAAAGDQTINLSHEPLPGSLEVVWHPDGLGGIVLTSAEWSLDGSTLTVPNTAGPFEPTDLIDPLYSYRDGPITPAIGPIVDWGAKGWRYVVLAETDQTDYSAAGIDDSSWSVGQAPFASGTAGNTYASMGWIDPSSPFALPDANRTVWLRRSVTLPDVPAAISARIDGQMWVYLDGTLIGSRAGNGATAAGPWAIPSNLLGATRELAVKATDDPLDPMGDYTYIDVQVD